MSRYGTTCCDILYVTDILDSVSVFNEIYEIGSRPTATSLV